MLCDGLASIRTVWFVTTPRLSISRAVACGLSRLTASRRRSLSRNRRVARLELCVSSCFGLAWDAPGFRYATTRSMRESRSDDFTAPDAISILHDFIRAKYVKNHITQAISVKQKAYRKCHSYFQSQFVSSSSCFERNTKIP